MRLVRPSDLHLASYTAALRRGWSPDTVRGVIAAQEELEWIGRDPAGFLATMEDLDAKGPQVKLPDGSTVSRLPGFRRWMWDGQFCGSIGFRWQPGTAELPPHCLGHIGYSVVPWKQGRGLATRALAQVLPEAWSRGLPYVEIVTDPENAASRRVIEANEGVFIEEFVKPTQYGSTQGLRYRIYGPGRSA